MNISADAFLDDLEKKLESSYAQVNERIKKKNNPYISIKTTKSGHKWSLPYHAILETNNEILSNIPQISINDLLNFINTKCPFSKEFTHITGRKHTNTIDIQPVFASILALGTNLGVNKMASISDMPLGVLRSATGSLIRLETLKNANDIIINEIATLPTFYLYHISDNKMHNNYPQNCD